MRRAGDVLLKTEDHQAFDVYRDDAKDGLCALDWIPIEIYWRLLHKIKWMSGGATMNKRMTEDEILASQFMFQYNWRNYNLEQSIERSLVEDWTVAAFRDMYRVGQRVYFMRLAAGRPIDERRFSAVGRIVSKPYQKPHPRTGELLWLIDVVYDYLVTPNYDRSKIVVDPDEEFRKYHPYVGGEFRTNFLLPANIAARTEQVLRPYLRPIGTSHRRVDKQVFLSYSRVDEQFALRLLHDLRQRLGGSDEAVWMDTQQLQGGQLFEDVIMEEIRDRPVFIVIVSPDSMASRSVKNEIGLAIHMDLADDSPGEKLIVPVLYREASMPPNLGMRNWVSFLPLRRYEESLDELMTVVNQAR
jgi:hypothetical protein